MSLLSVMAAILGLLLCHHRAELRQLRAGRVRHLPLHWFGGDFYGRPLYFRSMMIGRISRPLVRIERLAAMTIVVEEKAAVWVL